MSQKDETKRMLESSEHRRNRRVDALLNDPKVKATLQRDQHPTPDERGQKKPSRRLAAG